jgi:hypothetical protein
MLERTTILPNLWRAKVLLDVLDAQRSSANSIDLFVLLTDCYDAIVDDLLILAVVEIHAKAQLLRGGYAIHEISAPAALRKQQKTSPVHVRALRAASRRGQNVTFRANTVGISVLFEKEYRRRYGLPDALLGAVAGVRQRRNFVHLTEPFGWSLDRELLDLVEHLNAVVPRQKLRARRQVRGGRGGPCTIPSQP